MRFVGGGDDCNHTHVEWIETLFGACVETPREKASFALGLFSTVVGAYTTVPQVILNFQLHSAEGLSFGFIVLLLAGDVCNGIGIAVTHGLPTQIISAAWFITIDIFCIAQYVYYEWLRPRLCGRPNREEYEEMPRLPAGPLLVAAGAAAFAADCADRPYEGTCLWGSLLGWLSAGSYVTSRLPQIIHNFRRKKTEGLSIQLFICALLQNLAYGASIFLWDVHWSYIWLQFPWLVGSVGIIGFDVLVLGQFLRYGAEDHAEESPDDLSTIAPD
jgi:uncharacterized protein with PQ loop repeat